MLPIAEPFAPAWLVTAARFNPFYLIAQGIRVLFAGNIGDPTVWQGLLITLILTVVAIV